MAAERIWRIWLVDDFIPVTALGEKSEEVLERGLPIRADLLRAAVDQGPEAWEEEPVLNLVRELLSRPEVQVTAFLHPEVAIDSLAKGEPAPDLVILDWEFNTNPGTVPQHLSWMRSLLDSGFCFLKIYTHQATDTISVEVAEIVQEYGPTFLGVAPKPDVTAAILIDAATAAIRDSLAGEVHPGLRRIAERAVGRSLRQFAQLPPGILAEMTEDGVEVLSDMATRELAAANLDASTPAVEIAVTNAERLIGQDIRDMGTIPLRAGADDGQLRAFQSYQLYLKHSTDQVLRGDLAAYEGGALLILTPPCDLAYFAKKTRNTLTYLELYELDAAGWSELIYGVDRPSNVTLKGPPSMSAVTKIGTEGPYILPSVPAGTGQYRDYFVLPHRISHRRISGTVPGKALMYNHLDADFKGIRRLTSLSEPYLSALMWAVAHTLFSPGTRDFLSREKDRLSTLFKKLNEVHP